MNRDLLERAGWTFVQTALAVVLASGADFVNVSSLKAAAVAGLAAGLSVVKSYAKDKLDAKVLAREIENG